MAGLWPVASRDDVARLFDVNAPRDNFRDRVTAAAEAALKAGGSVGPLELFRQMGLLHSIHFDGWRKGNEHYRVLEEWIQVGPAKFEKALRHFGEWVQARGLHPIEANYTRRTPRGLEPLQVTADGNPEREKLYRTHYAPAELTERKTKQLAERLAKAPDLVVFEKVSEEGHCGECGAELAKGSFLFTEKSQPLCLACADLDHLVFLPAGDMALTRRARKHSPLSAVVVRFSRARKHYERQGLLVTNAALAQAEEECAADAPERAASRARAAVLRQATKSSCSPSPGPSCNNILPALPTRRGPSPGTPPSAAAGAWAVPPLGAPSTRGPSNWL